MRRVGNMLNRLEHLLVAPVVAHAEHEIHVVPHLPGPGQDDFDRLPLGCPLRGDLDDSIPLGGLHWQVCQNAVQVVEQLLGLPATIVRIGVLVVPYQSALLPFQITSIRALHVMLQNRQNHVVPLGLDLKMSLPPVTSRWPELVAMLCYQSQVLHSTEPSLQVLCPPSRNDDNGIRSAGAQVSKDHQHLFARLVGKTRRCHQSLIVIQKENAALGIPKRLVDGDFVEAPEVDVQGHHPEGIQPESETIELHGRVVGARLLQVIQVR
mmetsp:Transcript_3537/g.9960  ORF Transcript_3537/g.9960 Transcript_3537/m.9960 type:complete len:266 (-) Transcript_3537:1634-2431(-)